MIMIENIWNRDLYISMICIESSTAGQNIRIDSINLVTKRLACTLQISPVSNMGNRCPSHWSALDNKELNIYTYMTIY